MYDASNTLSHSLIVGAETPVSFDSAAKLHSEPTLPAQNQGHIYDNTGKKPEDAIHDNGLEQYQVQYFR